MEKVQKKIILSPLQKILGEDFNPGLLLIITKKSFIWCVVIILSTMSASLLYLRYTPPLYEATSGLLIKAENTSQDIGVGVSLATKMSDNDNYQKNIQLMKSKVILDQVVVNLPLEVSYFFIGQVLVEERYKSSHYEIIPDYKDPAIYGVPIFFRTKNKKEFEISFTKDKKKYQYKGYFNNKLQTQYLSFTAKLNEQSYAKNPPLYNSDKYYFVVNKLFSVEALIRKKIRIQPLPPTIAFSYQDNKAEKAADILNEVMKVFLDYDKTNKTESSTKVLDFINLQIGLLGTEIQAYDNQLKLFRISHGIVNPDAMGQEIYTALGTIKDKLKELNDKKNELTFFRDFFISHYDSSSMLSGIAITNFPSIASYIQSLDALGILKKEQLLDLAPNNPKVKVLNSQIEDVKRNILNNINNSMTSLNDEIAPLEKEYDETKIKFNEYPYLESEYDSIAQLSDLKRKYYLLFLDKQIQFSITQAGFVSNFLKIRNAEVPTIPAFPNVNMIKISGIVSGIVISLLFILIRYLMSNKILSISEIDRFCEAGLIGVVPIYKRPMDVSQLVVNMSPKSVISESFRSIRTNLDYIQVVKGSKIITITSTIAGEGKTFVAVNIAGIHAVAGKRTIILDFDLRKPRIHKSFSTENNKGLSTILIGKYGVEECIKHSEWDNLDFLTSGPIPPNPAEFIMSKQTEDLLAYLKTKYDIIVIDTPPIGIVTDALELLKKSDYPIYVMRADYSSRNFMNNVNRVVIDNKITRLSVVLNGMGQGASGYSYNYGYGYGYGYGGGGYGGYGSSSYGYGYYSDAAPPKDKFLKRTKKNLKSLFTGRS